MDADARLDAAVGSVADEAAKLLEALARSQTPRGEEPRRDEDAPRGEATARPPRDENASATADPAGAEHVHVAMGDAETCSWCPVCRSVTALKGVSPETLGRLADLATTAAALLAELASRHTGSPSEPTAPTDRARTDRTPRTEPIAVVDEEELS